MIFKRFLTGILGFVMALSSATATTTDSEGYPVMYLRGNFSGWSAQNEYQFDREGDVYTLTLESFPQKTGNSSTMFKVSDDSWTIEFGAGAVVSGIENYEVVKGGENMTVGADDLHNVSFRFKLPEGASGAEGEKTILQVGINGEFKALNDPEPEDPEETISMLSGTLPVLYINVYTDAEHTTLNREVMDRNLSHKNYFSNAEYWLDLNGCEWLEAEGAKSIGSKEEPLPLEIKARGNFTRKGFSKKPFKLKLGKKQSLLGLSKSKHFALLAHADDNYGYMRNFTGFSLGRKIGLPWTPWQQPVEVVINGDYRGLYFLTESIRAEEGRVEIEELEDNDPEPANVSGGYIVELDNYWDPNQIWLKEKSCAQNQALDTLRVTWDTPEVYSSLQKRFITDQFTAMNDAVGVANSSDELWKYMDLDDAARYYLVCEIISHVESYHGSTYLFRDRGEGQKWHFSPLWDCGNGFNGSTNNFLYNCDPFGNTWIPSLRMNEKFNEKVKETWKWFMNTGYQGIEDELRAYAAHISEAAKADRKRWAGEPKPNYNGAQDVVDNTDMEARLQAVLDHLNAKTSWLKGQFGDYAQTPDATEPERDATEAAPLPEYAKEGYEYDRYEDFPTLYARGANLGGWAAADKYKFTRNQNVYTLELEELNGEFKIGSGDWDVNFGAETANVTISGMTNVNLTSDGKNFKADGLRNVSLRLTLEKDGQTYKSEMLEVGLDGKFLADLKPTGTLPVLYINVYADADHGALNNEVIDRNLSHKDYFKYAEYWIEDATGEYSLGSSEGPLELQIKARGNYTRKGFSKKPFKLKLKKAASLLGLSSSKHFAILAHADDSFGYMRNFTGFWLGKKIGLPWTPWQQPVEVVINGDYRGIYFLTESIRVEEERVNITALDDLDESDGLTASGGYLVELDNYPEDNQTVLVEKSPNGICGPLRITWDTPEAYSDIQKKFVGDQFEAMNDAVGEVNHSDELWRYMDLDDAARYYLVEEIISHYEAYHGSTYLYRDRGEGQKWHFSPLWDCGHAFEGGTNNYFYHSNQSLGTTWISSIRMNEKFNEKVKETWTWFMNSIDGLSQLEEALKAYKNQIAEAAKMDAMRWKDQPLPNPYEGEITPVADNSDMDASLSAVMAQLRAKVEWLSQEAQFGSYATSTEEPERDDTEAAPLPAYAREGATKVVLYFSDTKDNPWDNVYAYTYLEPQGQTKIEHLGSWPGTLMESVHMGASMPSLKVYRANEGEGDDSQEDVDLTSNPLWKVTLPTYELEEGHKVIFNNGNSGQGNQTNDMPAAHMYVYGPDGIVTGVENVGVDAEAAVRYFNLQGIEVMEPQHGRHYLQLRGNEIMKIRY